jgi:AsmA family protein
MERQRAIRWGIWLGLPVVAIILLVVVWRWDWFIPMVEPRVSAALGRDVTIGHLHVSPGRRTDITLTDVTIANPPGWNGDPLAHIDTLALEVDVWAYLRHGALIVPWVALEQPRVRLVQQSDNKANYELKLSGGSSSSGTTQIGDLRISDGDVHAQLAKLKADFIIRLETKGEGSDAKLIANARGTYGAAPITASAIGGALLSLHDPSHPWPIDLKLQNGETHLTLTGTLQDPVHLAGAALKLQLAGQDMGQLENLAGFPIPKTPPYHLVGNLNFAEKHVRFTNFEGHVGSSDLEGEFNIDPGRERMLVKAELQSRQVDLADLGGLIGTEPGRTTTPGQTPAKRAEVRHAEEKSNLLPDKPINVPQLKFADVALRYRGQHVKGRSVPLDNLLIALDIEDGQIYVHPVSFGVGAGKIKIDIRLTPENKTIHAKADADVRQLDVSRMMAATHVFHGAGTISGTARFDGKGNSMAAMLADGDGEARLGMAGGDLSSLLVDISGLQFGNAVLSALGFPTRTEVECFVTDVALRQGDMTLRTFVLDTKEGIVNGNGGANLRNETLDLHLRTEPKHFSIGSLPAPINITGTFKSPTIRPGAEAAARGGLAAGLAAIFPPLALLPTIQFGSGDDHRCDNLLAGARREAGGRRLPAPDGPAQK